jgi:peptide methionine sulfoxide reductase MsrB
MEALWITEEEKGMKQFPGDSWKQIREGVFVCACAQSILFICGFHNCAFNSCRSKLLEKK